MKRKLFLFASLALAMLSGLANANEKYTVEPVQPNGKPANAPMAVSSRVKNWSSFGLGCCVCASSVANCNHVNMRDVGEAIRKRSLQEPGGHYPEKLDRVLQDVKKQFPTLQWTQWSDEGDEGIRKIVEWNAKGFPVGITWGTGERYSMRPIAHMVSLIHADASDSGFWGIVDNNFPEEVCWVPSPEGKRRHEMGGGGWATVIIPTPDKMPRNPNMPVIPVVGSPVGFAFVVIGVLALEIGIVVLACVAIWGVGYVFLEDK